VFVPGGDGVLVARAETASWSVATGGRVQLRVRGTTNAVESARRTLVGPEPLRLEPGIGGVPGEPGVHTVRLAEAIRQSDRLRNIGLSIASAEPPEISVRVHRLQSVRLPVRVVAAGGGAGVFVGEPVVEPGEVLVRLPSELASGLGDGAFGRVELSVEQMGMFSEAEPRTLSGLRVVLPAEAESARSEVRAGVSSDGLATGFGGLVTVSPRTVSVTAQLSRRVRTLELAPVPVWLVLPSTEGTGWDVEVLDKLLPGVSATGPQGAIDRLERGDLVAIAFLTLSSDELERGVETKAAIVAAVQPGLIGLGEFGASGLSGGVVPGVGGNAGRIGAGGAGGVGGVGGVGDGGIRFDTAGSPGVRLRIVRRDDDGATTSTVAPSPAGGTVGSGEGG